VRRIDPHGRGLDGWLGRLFDEALGIGVEGVIEGPLSGGLEVVGLAVVDLVRGHEADPGMVVVLVVPSDDAAADVWAQGPKRLASSMQPKRSGNSGWYVRVLKWASENGLALEVEGRLCDMVTPRSASIRAVALACMGPPRSAWRVRWPGVLSESVVEQRREQGGTLGIGDALADDPAAEEVEDDVEVEVGLFRQPHQLGEIPGPDLIGTFGQQFGFGVDGMAQRIAAFPDFGVVGQDAVSGADRAEGSVCIN
jgi:hypothetical protein